MIKLGELLVQEGTGRHASGTLREVYYKDRNKDAALALKSAHR